MALTQCRLDLPAGFRPADSLEFHGRDAQAVGERSTAERLDKGLVWQGRPACLSIVFRAHLAEIELAIDGGSAEPAALAATARRLLGLDQPVEAFEQAHASHRQLAPLLARQSGLRVPLAATPFEALSWAITGQQISLPAARRRRYWRSAGWLQKVLCRSTTGCCYQTPS